MPYSHSSKMAPKGGQVIVQAADTPIPKAAAKYRKGDVTWGGCGSQPAWVKAHLDDGGSLQDLKA